MFPRLLDWGWGHRCLHWRWSPLRQMPSADGAVQDSEAECPRLDPGLQGRAWPQSPALPALSLPPLLRQPSLRGCRHGPRASQPAPTLCLALRCSQLPPGHSPQEHSRSPRAHHSPHCTSCHRSRAMRTWAHPLLLPTPTPTHPVPTPETRASPRPVLSHENGICSVTNVRWFSSQVPGTCPSSDFPASTLIGTQAPAPHLSPLDGPCLCHSTTPAFLTLPPQPRPSTGLRPQGPLQPPLPARVPREPSLSPGMTFSCPHAQPCGLGSLLPPDSFSLLCLCCPSAWHSAPG